MSNVTAPDELMQTMQSTILYHSPHSEHRSLSLREKPMPNDPSITHWFRLLQNGELDAAQPLWEHYFTRLQGLARKLLQGRRFAVADAEDVALSAFHSLSQGLRRGRFPQLKDRDNLWTLLVVITARKVSHLVRDQRCKKRGGDLLSADLESQELEQIITTELTPEFVVQSTEECQRLLESLGSKELAEIALLKMEGYLNQEIADRCQCALRTIDRKLRLIRIAWKNSLN